MCNFLIFKTLSSCSLWETDETRSPAVVMATANNLQDLPPEFLWAGRFDAKFSVDLPTSQEREKIIRIMNHRYGYLIH
jgi:SpoVK/Ycf46/Vps4 family AAA+-type ATPase